jgi:hypothetical protein
MTNVELNKLSVAELRELRNRVTEMLQLKMQLEGKLNKDTLQVGMTVRYIGGKNKIKNETFVIEKIKSVNALCKSNVTGTKWNINLANIEQCNRDSDLPDSLVKNEINLDLLSMLKNERNPEGFQK